jgi:hypothetical protein
MTTHDKNVWSNYLFMGKNMTKRVITDSTVCLQYILYCLDDLSVKTKTTNRAILPKNKIKNRYIGN